MRARLGAPTSPGVPTYQYVAHPPTSGLVAPPPAPSSAIGSWRPTATPSTPVVSYTNTPQGGAPGATFGPPGVAGAPVPQVGGFALTPGLLLGLGVVAVAIYLVTR